LELGFSAMAYIYREVVTFVEWFTLLPFTATGAPPAARHMQILKINQRA
jgi:hypothetical protein